jgi:hypothetical protein
MQYSFFLAAIAATDVSKLKEKTMHGFIKVELALQSEEILPRKNGKEEREKEQRRHSICWIFQESDDVGAHHD